MHHIKSNNSEDNLNGEIELIKHSSYYPDGNIPNAVNINANTFNIPSLNCSNLNAKFDELNIKLQQIHNNGTEIHAICLQETWLTNDADTSLFQIDGIYTVLRLI